ncbi:MAG: hypothetical protein H7318_12070 [Oligoflexus sp.]|nr:hypothetical protein [Oligoflexus sp.]
MKNYTSPAIFVTSLLLSSCGQTSSFKGDAPIAASRAPSNVVSASEPVKEFEGSAARRTPSPAPSDLRFDLSVARAVPVVRAQNVEVLTSIQDLMRNGSLAEDVLKLWKVKVSTAEGRDGLEQPVGSQRVDLSQQKGQITLTADFLNPTTGQSGKATKALFVDDEAPKIKLMRTSDSKDGQSSELLWSATDNYKLDESKLVLIACSDYVTSFRPSQHAQLSTLPANCVNVAEGEKLVAIPSTATFSSLPIGGSMVSARDLRYGLYAEDLVGLSSFVWINDVGQESGTLVLSASPTGMSFTNSTNVTMKFKLLEVVGGLVTQIDDSSKMGRWEEFAFNSVATPASHTPLPSHFNPSLAIQLGPKDGVYSFVSQVKMGKLISNQQTVSYTYDTIPPQIDTIQVTIDKVIPSPESTINVSWIASDLNGIAEQILEVKGASSATWTKVSNLSATARTTAFKWENRPSENFQVRIKATDLAGNVGSGTGSWVKQIFNAAVLTSNVQCFFCHLKIEGDVGGIDLASVIGRADTGQNFSVIGKIFGTAAVPDLIGRHASATVPNYLNKDYKIFPKDEKFPVIDAAALKAKMLGAIRLGSLQITNTHTGNLVLDGSTATGPFEIKGEVFIDGDLIIKGQYRGVGSIYARNIFIVNDLTAVKSPFPFDVDPGKASVQAQASIIRGDDGLYLGALGEIIVGNVEVKILQDSVSKVYYTNANPYAWFAKDKYFALGTQAAWPKKKDGTDVTNVAGHSLGGNPTTSTKVRNEVNRVDAYLFAQSRISWRAYNSILLNGGFMSPVGGFVSTVPANTYQRGDLVDFALNPKNGQSVNQNLVRYDYRLRIGGGGFETIKSYFDQQ